MGTDECEQSSWRWEGVTGSYRLITGGSVNRQPGNNKAESTQSSGADPEA